MKSLAVSPSPNHRITSGMMATSGVAYRALTSQSVAASIELVAPDQQAQHDADDGGVDKSDQQGPQAADQRVGQFAAGNQPAPALEDRARIGHEQRVDLPPEIFPGADHHDMIEISRTIQALLLARGTAD